MRTAPMVFGIQGLCCLMLMCALAAPGHAQTVAAARVVRGLVVRIDGPEFVVDLGAAAGLSPGTPLVLYRTIRARHPVTGKEVLDRFPIGQAVAAEVAERLAILRPDAALARLLQVGDRVEFTIQPVVAPQVVSGGEPDAAAPSSGSDAACPACPAASASCTPGEVRQPDLVDAEATYLRTLGKPPEERVQLWQQYLKRNPSTSLRKAVETEIDAMSVLAADVEISRGVSAESGEARRLAQTVHHAELPRLRAGEPAWLVFAAADWSQVQDLRVHFRRQGEGPYRMSRPEPSGRLARRLRVPADVAIAPGFEYFVELTNPQGKEIRLFASAALPTVVAIHPPLGRRPTPANQLTTLRVTAEHVDFNRYRGDDALFAAAMDVTFRLGTDSVLYAFSMGYGLLSGRGGRVAEVDLPDTLHTNGPDKGKPIRKGDTIDPRPATFKHAFLGGEWALSENLHALTRVVVGLDEQGLDTGVEVAARVGPETATNLQVGASTLGDMGRAAFVALTTNVVDRVPMTGLFEVTDRPVGEDLGIRLIYEANWRATDNLGLTGRVGYDLRTIDHAGPSLGGGIALYW